MSAYDPQNIFARILRGELPCYKVFEDDQTFAFMDIMPRSEGHALVIPKSPARNLFDIEPDSLAATISTTQRVARAAKAALQADGITVQQFNESAGGQVVFHLHVHVLPRWDGVPLRPHSSTMADAARLQEHAALIAAAIERGPANA